MCTSQTSDLSHEVLITFIIDLYFVSYFMHYSGKCGVGYRSIATEFWKVQGWAYFLLLEIKYFKQLVGTVPVCSELCVFSKCIANAHREVTDMARVVFSCRPEEPAEVFRQETVASMLKIVTLVHALQN